MEPLTAPAEIIYEIYKISLAQRAGEYLDLPKYEQPLEHHPIRPNLVAGGGWLFDRRRHRQEVESLRADNRQKDMNLSKMYVDEFKENIADRFLS